MSRLGLALAKRRAASLAGIKRRERLFAIGYVPGNIGQLDCVRRSERAGLVHCDENVLAAPISQVSFAQLRPALSAGQRLPPRQEFVRLADLAIGYRLVTLCSYILGVGLQELIVNRQLLLSILNRSRNIAGLESQLGDEGISISLTGRQWSAGVRR